MSLKKINIKQLSFNPFTKIGKEWMLITSGDAEKHNTMTASWGGVGILWGKSVATVYIRPQRYTFEFVEKNSYYSLCFFDESHRAALNFCGSKSGRNFDKAKETGLTPNFSELAPYYEEADIVFICKKLYRQDLDKAAFISEEIPDTIYPTGDFHRIYIGEIVEVLKR